MPAAGHARISRDAAGQLPRRSPRAGLERRGRRETERGTRTDGPRTSAARFPSTDSGWLLLRAWNDEPDPDLMDIYRYATTSPIYVRVGDQPRRSRDAAPYFLRWLDRIQAATERNTSYRTTAERGSRAPGHRPGPRVLRTMPARSGQLVGSDPIGHYNPSHEPPGRTPISRRLACQSGSDPNSA